MNMNGLITKDHDTLQLLAAHNATQTTSTMTLVNHHVGHWHKVFASRPNHANARFGRRFFRQDFSGTASTLTPSSARVTEFDLTVFNVEVHWLLGFTFNNDVIPASKLQLMSKLTANVCASNQRTRPRRRPKRRDGRTT